MLVAQDARARSSEEDSPNVMPQCSIAGECDSCKSYDAITTPIDRSFCCEQTKRAAKPPLPNRGSADHVVAAPAAVVLAAACVSRIAFQAFF